MVTQFEKTTLQLFFITVATIGAYLFVESYITHNSLFAKQLELENEYMLQATGNACCFYDYKAYQKLNNFTKFQEMDNLTSTIRNEITTKSYQAITSAPLIIAGILLWQITTFIETRSRYIK